MVRLCNTEIANVDHQSVGHPSQWATVKMYVKSQSRQSLNRIIQFYNYIFFMYIKDIVLISSLVKYLCNYRDNSKVCSKLSDKSTKISVISRAPAG
jgi:hypothetical protein